MKSSLNHGYMKISQENRNALVLRLLKLAADIETCDAEIISLDVGPQYQEINSFSGQSHMMVTGASKVTMEISGPSGITTLKFEGSI